MKNVRIKSKYVVGIIIVLLVILIIMIAMKLDFGTTDGAIYGTRLDIVKKNKITDKVKKEIKENVESTEKTESVNVSVQGRIINVLIKVKEDTSRDDAKTLADRVVEKIGDEEKKLYDIQVFIEKKNDDAFPIIGYRHHNKDYFSWTLDR